MTGFEQWCRMLGWQTRVLLEREGFELGRPPAAQPAATTSAASIGRKGGKRFTARRKGR